MLRQLPFYLNVAFGPTKQRPQPKVNKRTGSTKVRAMIMYGIDRFGIEYAIIYKKNTSGTIWLSHFNVTWVA